MESLQLGDLQTNARGGKYLPIEPPLRWNSTEWAEVIFEPSAFDGNGGDRVTLCLRLTDEAAAFVDVVEKGAVSLAAKNAKIFGSLQSEAQMKQRLQSNVRLEKRSFKMKMSLSRVRCWDASGARLSELPELRGCKVLVAVEARQLWVMGQQCGVLLEVRDIKVGESMGCPL